MSEPPRASPFEGRLIRLRAVEESELDWINREFWNPNVNRFLAIAWPESVDGTRGWWGATRRHDPGPLLIETLEARERVGVCTLEGIDPRPRTAVLGIWVSEAQWDQGYGTDAVRTACRFAFDEMNLQRVGLQVYETNPRAIRAYEKAGFREEGRLRRAHFIGGRLVDVIVMGCLADEFAWDSAGQPA
jgi:RimJ/RimL family protein N-acetyltransferase